METEYKFGEVHDLAAQIESGTDRVHFKNLISTGNGGTALVAFKAGQKLETHVAPANLMVYTLEGEIEFTVLDHPHDLSAGRFILVGKDVPHSVIARTDAKMLLIKIKD